MLHDLENIDDDLDDFGIKLVTTEDIKYAGQVLKIRRIPSLGIFRNGQFKLYEGPLNDESELLSWLVDTDTLDLPGTIEKVTGIILSNKVERLWWISSVLAWKRGSQLARESQRPHYHASKLET